MLEPAAKRMNIWYLSAHDQPRGASARTYDFAYDLMQPVEIGPSTQDVVLILRKKA